MSLPSSFRSRFSSCIWRSGALVVLLSALANTSAQAAPKADAKQVAERVQAFYDRTKAVQSKFQQVYYLRLYKKKVTSKGQVVVKKPGKMRWSYGNPAGKVIVSDGKVVKVYDPPEGGEPGQIFEQAIAGHQLPLAFSFLLGTARLDADFSFQLLDPKRYEFERGYVLKLLPKKPNPQFEALVLFVEKEGDALGAVRRVLIVETSGNLNWFNFSDMKFNAKVDDGVFRFEAPKGTRRARL